MRLILVRHGETLWNKQKRYQGQTDIDLSKKGISQSKLIAKRLKGEKIDIIYTSKLARAIDTAEEINKFHNVKIVKTKLLNEFNWGIFEGQKKGFIIKNYPEVYTQLKKKKSRYKIPKGESISDIKKRIIEFLRELKDENVLIAAHNGSNRMIMGVLFKIPNKDLFKIVFENTSITIIVICNNKAELKLFNSSKHLQNESQHQK